MIEPHDWHLRSRPAGRTNVSSIGGATDTGWIDVSPGLYRDLLTWPGNLLVELNLNQRIASGDGANVSELYIGTHSGTHVDPPVHFWWVAPASTACCSTC